MPCPPRECAPRGHSGVDAVAGSGLTGELAELGCGYGTFTLPLARRTAGTVHAIDIDPAMIDTVRRRAAAERLTNINARLRDVMTEGFGLEDRCDACLLFSTASRRLN